MRQFLLVVLFVWASLAYGQQITASGISIQGNLKNDLGQEIVNETLEINFQFRKYTADETYVSLFSDIVQNITLDAYGNFSTVLPLNDSSYTLLQQNAQEKLILVLVYNKVDILLMPLHPVPYAAVSFDGVPIGTIVPFVGKAIPLGYLLCDGRSIPSSIKFSELRSIFGNNTPNLTGVFLRGAGTNGSKGNAKGPIFKDFQEDALQGHRHSMDIQSEMSVNKNGGEKNYIDLNPSGDVQSRNIVKISGQTNDLSDGKNPGGAFGVLLQGIFTVTDLGHIENHTHSLDVSVDSYGVDGDTRPRNYGVKYIVKY